MGTIVVLLLLGWLAATAALTIGVGSRGGRTRSNDAAATRTMMGRDEGVSPTAIVVGSVPDSPAAPARLD